MLSLSVLMVVEDLLCLWLRPIKTLNLPILYALHLKLIPRFGELPLYSQHVS